MSDKNDVEDYNQTEEDCSESINYTIQGFQDQLLLLQNQSEMQHQNTTDANLMFPAGDLVSPIFPWTLPPPPPLHQPYNSVRNPIRDHHHDPFFLPPPTPSSSSSSSYGGFFNRRPPPGSNNSSSVGMQFGYEHLVPPSSSSDHHHHLRFISDSIGQVVQSSSAPPFGLQAELQKMTAQEIMDAKALAASKSHSEAERRRRERINNHLAKLRSLLPNTTKTDKASLLAEVIQHVKELKRQTSLIAETNTVPTEMDELTVDNASDENGKLVIKASLCCQDRSDLLPDLINTLKSLRLRTLKAEITTLAGRVKNVLFITTEDDNTNENDHDDDHPSSAVVVDRQHYSIINSIQEALKAVMDKAAGDDQSASASVKRQRTNINIYP